jgi:diadenosine tetraphosphatase ApaH/serine/threonine PP2A family protein phosphatase/Ca2+-binding EF-hand superfamily protein
MDLTNNEFKEINSNIIPSTALDDPEINDALKHVLNIVEMEEERDYVSNSELFDQLLTTYCQELNSYLLPRNVDKDYVGVHLGKIYEDNDLKLLLKAFKNNLQLDPFYVFNIVKDANEKLASMPNIRECHVNDPLEHGVIIVGDIHGNFNDLYHLFQKYGIPGLNFKYIFNGDYVDRGEKQIECLIILLYAFLIRPEKVFISRGNHEDISMNTNLNFYPNFLVDCQTKFGKYGTAIFYSAIDLFSNLPLACILTNNITNKKFFCVHGGISDKVDLDFIQRKIERQNYKAISWRHQEIDEEHHLKGSKHISDLLWSDPFKDEKKEGCCFNSHRNLGSMFGADVTRNFCERHGFNAIIRSHQVREKGYSEDHPKCLTVFSASNYCGGSNYGAIFKIEPNSFKPRPHRYKNKLSNPASNLVSSNHVLIKHFKRLIRENEDKLLEQFEKVDLEQTGRIKVDQWAEIVENVFNKEISKKNLIKLKDFLCECETALGLVNYRTMFTAKNSESEQHSEKKKYNKMVLNVLRNLFHIMDRNNDKRLSIDEVKKALKTINKSLVKGKVGEKYKNIEHQCNEFLNLIDKDHDNMISMNDFARTFFGDEDEVTQ